MRILIVDDDRTNRAVLRAFCKAAGVHEIDEAANGELAVDLWRESVVSGRPYALVLMDLHMPGGGGLEAISRIRADARSRDLTPELVLTTADLTRAAINGGYGAGADAYLAKPLDREAVVRKVVEVERDEVIRGQERDRRQALEQETRVAAELLQRITASELELFPGFWQLSKPSNGLISGDLVCAGWVRGPGSPAGAWRGLVADNMGHGVGAALTSVSLHDAFKAVLDLPLGEAFMSINNRMQQVLPLGVFTCGVLWEVRGDTIQIINAGMPAVVVGTAVVSSQQLPLGIAQMREAAVADEYALDEGGWIYSDGLSEAFGGVDLSPEWFNDNSPRKETWAEFLEMMNHHDDITLVRLEPVRCEADGEGEGAQEEDLADVI